MIKMITNITNYNTENNHSRNNVKNSNKMIMITIL